ncbi:MAG: hypothetical protein A3G59_00605 [Candidatus Taylorbacteria bacterium RIFCSPLOWO2_12_FULL_47_20]|uniref:Uncharacterized protein n=2 Tax=Candidatus Tayloriibacteriota TaxID=1817919 RepID=A0A1G2P708_9BACT|nr:MAG: hypothetical protein A3H68_01290 [Candidatus Taylorbacteria bacterium RIFCSPLOWO2_02_FULL_46_40]OHA44144.1 MAG: hypothetical protein A3G59_00605 [Candidatus Taylorbacteria bacterium RIFCSPLOWO2_12_FULL_47_20]
MLASNAGVFPDDQVEYFLRNENRGQLPELLSLVSRLGRDQRLALPEAVKDDSRGMPVPSDLAQHWEKRWKDVWEIKADFAGLIIPKPPTLFHARLTLMHEKGSNSPELLYRGNEKLMSGTCKHWKYCSKSLDKKVPTHNFTGTFGCWVEDADEAPFGNLGGINLHTNAVRELRQFGVRTTTLPVRLALGADVYLENDSKKQLDMDVVTMCAESETADGSVPFVDFGRGRGGVCVNDCCPGGAGGGGTRFRRAVYPVQSS